MTARLSVLDLARLRGRAALFGVLAAVGLLLAAWLVSHAGMPTWGGTLVFLALIAVPATLKWHDDLRQYGLAVLVLSVLLALQGFHTAEHVVQVTQYYGLGRPGVQSQGLISSLNVEWVHFIWNWLAWGAVAFLFRRGLRGVWGWALLLWITAHSLEHSRMLWHYLSVSRDMQAMGMSGLSAVQVLPGILGRDGWLAVHLPGLRVIPGLTSLPRVMIHFNWNVGEMTLLLLAAHTNFSRLIDRPVPAPVPPIPPTPTPTDPHPRTATHD